MVVGGGILGLATARELALHRGLEVTVLEKEPRWSAHQTGRNSGVIHAGLYYRPGSLKARMAVAGNASMLAYAREAGVPAEVCGKLVVATDESELPRLAALAENASANGVPADYVEAAEAKRIEPEVSCVAALHVHSTGIVDYTAICLAMVEELRAHGADLRRQTRVTGIRTLDSGRGVIVEAETEAGPANLRADALVNCAGLHSDRIARLAGLTPRERIVPFRGEYYELRPERRHLVRGLIYPVPDPRFPFLGVHLTRMIDGAVHAGPNAVLALRREGYHWSAVSPRDVADSLGFSGTWRLGRDHWRPGIDEVLRSFSRRRFAHSLSRLVPAIHEDDLIPAPSGVRAQALDPDGTLVDDFLIEAAPNQVHVLNAPSPAATAALEIARHVADRLAETIG